METPLNKEIDLIVSAMAMHHVENIEDLFEVFAAHLQPGGAIALADLDKEDGTFHSADVQGVFHHGFDRDKIQALLEKRGFENVAFHTAVVVQREHGSYPVFLVTAIKH